MIGRISRLKETSSAKTPDTTKNAETKSRTFISLTTRRNTSNRLVERKRQRKPLPYGIFPAIVPRPATDSPGSGPLPDRMLRRPRCRNQAVPTPRCSAGTPRPTGRNTSKIRFGKGKIRRFPGQVLPISPSPHPGAMTDGNRPVQPSDSESEGRGNRRSESKRSAAEMDGTK